jgi:hypothetical protein
MAPPCFAATLRRSLYEHFREPESANLDIDEITKGARCRETHHLSLKE